MGDVCTYGDIRLVGGTTANEGRIEVCVNDQWGTVCEGGFGYSDALVVCNQLGFNDTGLLCNLLGTAHS